MFVSQKKCRRVTIVVCELSLSPTTAEDCGMALDAIESKGSHRAADEVSTLVLLPLPDVAASCRVLEI